MSFPRWLPVPLFALLLFYLGLVWASVRLAKRTTGLTQSQPLGSTSPKVAALQVCASAAVGVVAGASAGMLAVGGDSLRSGLVQFAIVVLVVTAPYVWRFLDVPVQTSPTHRWLAMAITLPFFCGALLGAAAVAALRLLV